MGFKKDIGKKLLNSMTKRSHKRKWTREKDVWMLKNVMQHISKGKSNEVGQKSTLRAQ